MLIGKKTTASGYDISAGSDERNNEEITIILISIMRNKQRRINEVKEGREWIEKLSIEGGEIPIPGIMLYTKKVLFKTDAEMSRGVGLRG